MIIDMKKYIFVGAREDIGEFFVDAQNEGFVEFIKTSKGRPHELVPEAQKLVDAIKILRKQPLMHPYEEGGDLDFADQIAGQVIHLKAEVERLKEEARFLESEMARVGPFGDFATNEIKQLEAETGRTFQFFCVKTSKSHVVEDAEELVYVGTEYDLDYYVAFTKDPKHYPGVIEMHVEKSVSELKSHYQFVKETLHQVEAELKGYAGHIEFLRLALLDQLDTDSLERAVDDVSHPLEGKIFAIEGWVPENRVKDLPNLTEGKAVFFEPIAEEKDDRVPTYMENKGTPRLGEDIVKIYDVPAATDKDPSGWVFWAFMLFFAIILADGGYGLLFLGLAIFLHKKFPTLKGAKKRFVKILTILASSCIIWGVLTTSFFGINFSPQNPLSKISLLQNLAIKKADFHLENKDDVYKEWVKEIPRLANSRTGEEMLLNGYKIKEGKREYQMLGQFKDNLLLELSLLIGVIHISIGLLRYVRRSWANLGWVLFLIGGYFYFPSVLDATSLFEFMGWVTKSVATTFGFQLICVGVGGAIALAIIQKRVKGLGEVANVIQVFADVLSYLRLYALAIASSILAETFNGMGESIGLVVGVFIILIGHSVNILLGTMGGVIHGLRLNFIEWYHYCYDGEGKLFNPLRKLKTNQET